MNNRKQLKEYSKYWIEDNGVVYYYKNSIQFVKMKPASDKKGYLHISLYSNSGIRKTFLIHRLVAELFCDNPDNYKYVNHLDGDKSNNHANNLEWCNNSHNLRHAYKNGLKSAKGMKNGRAKFTNELIEQVRLDFTEGISRKDLSIKYNISYSHIVSILANKRR